jgi:protoheme IX farnesyltransferase
MLMGMAINWLAAGLLAFTIVFYAVVYTMWLKRWTAQNIVIGGLAGALPPAIGWAAATGSRAAERLADGAIIFLWTPPHFWALSLYISTDYAKAGVPMLPVVKGAKDTRKQILIYSLILIPVCLRRCSPAWAARCIWPSRPGRRGVPDPGLAGVPSTAGDAADPASRRPRPLRGQRR